MGGQTLSGRGAGRIGLALVTAGFAIGLGTVPASAESFTLRVGAGHPDVLSYVAEFKNYFIPTAKERVEKETDHTVSFLEAYGGSVAKLPEVFDAVESGLLDIGLLSTPFEPSNLFLQNFGYRAPFGESDPVEAGKITRELYAEIPALTETLEKNNQHMIAVLNSSNYALITNFEWQTLADLQGHKIQAAGANLQWLNDTGATPVQGGLSESYNGIQTGVFDGMLIHYQGMNGFKLYEVAPYIAKISFGSLPINMVTVNTSTWDRLPEDVQKIFEEVGLEYEARVNEENRKLDQELIAAMKEKGAKVLDISTEVQANWAKQVRDLPVTAAKEGDDLGLPMRELLKAYVDKLVAKGNKAAAAYSIE